VWGASSALPVPFANEPFDRAPAWPCTAFGDGETKDARWLGQVHAE